jgi:hypothetical protein
MRYLILFLCAVLSMPVVAQHADTLALAGLYFNTTTREWIELKHRSDGTWDTNWQKPGQPLRPERRRVPLLSQTNSSNGTQARLIWALPMQLTRDTLFVFQRLRDASTDTWCIAEKRAFMTDEGANKPMLIKVASNDIGTGIHIGTNTGSGMRPARALLNSLQGTFLLGETQALVLNRPTPGNTGLWAWAADTAVHHVQSESAQNTWRAGVVVHEDTQRVVLYVSVPDYSETFALIPTFALGDNQRPVCTAVAVVPLKHYFGDRPQQLMTLRETRDPDQVVLGANSFRYTFAAVGPSVELQRNPALLQKLKNYTE